MLLDSLMLSSQAHRRFVLDKFDRHRVLSLFAWFDLVAARSRAHAGNLSTLSSLRLAQW